jgi:transposase
MNVIVERGCGLDVHKDTVVACLAVGAVGQTVHKETRTFLTTTPDLLALSDWLSAAQCTHVAMESTGVYWKPIYNLLEGQFTLVVVNAQHVKAIRGHKTDVADSEWLADLLRHGLLKGSFVPSADLRALRDLTRYRMTLVQEHARFVNRLQKVLEDANIKLASVASNVVGMSGRAILKALVDGQTDPEALANLAQGRLRKKHAALCRALQGRMRPHHSFMLGEILIELDNLDDAIERVSAEIARRLEAETDAIDRLDAIPGVNRRVAEVILSEIGTDMSRFDSAEHLASWAGMCPGNNESAGKRLSGKTRKGSRWLRSILCEAAHGASHTKASYFAALYHHLVGRRGKKRALVAVGHAILKVVFHMLKDKTAYTELGDTYLDERNRIGVVRRSVKRLEKLGYTVKLQPHTAGS